MKSTCLVKRMCSLNCTVVTFEAPFGQVHSVLLFVGSTKVIFKTFLLFFVYSDWLRVNHLSVPNKEKEMVFLTFFAPETGRSKFRQMECGCS